MKEQLTAKETIRIKKLEKRLADVIRLANRSYKMARKYEVEEARIDRLIQKLKA